MSLSIHKCLMKNPNGRSGCACSPHSKRADCTPPYLCFTATEAHDPRNPVFVVGYKCLASAMRKAENTSTVKAIHRAEAPAPVVAPERAPAPEPASVADLLAEALERLAADAT